MKTHKELVSVAVSWLQKIGCSVVITEMATQECEEPDAIGWNNRGFSTLIECKSTRSDFLSDFKKSYRRLGYLGQHRLYLTNPGVTRHSELPTGWGMLECFKKIVFEVYQSDRFEPDFQKQQKILLSAIRRGACRGIEKSLIRCKYYTNYPRFPGYEAPIPKASLFVKGDIL